jgi:ATP-dependent DNA helicase DinG
LTEEAGVLRTVDVFNLLEKQLPNYEARPQQLDLALSIEYSFKSGKTGIFEAGTGTGKSLAALIPAALSHKRVVVSTATIALQEQYIHKDIPALQAILPFEFTAGLLKGRNNYLGLRRWEEALREHEVDNRLIDWVESTAAGDLSELEFVPTFDIWREINSDTDDCLRNNCPRFSDCFYFKAKREADKADILVVNHALLLADAASLGGILAPYDLLIVDEAHHLADVATDVFSTSISTGGLKAMTARAIKKVGAPAGLIQEIESTADNFFRDLAMRFDAPKARLRKPIETAYELLGVLALLKQWLEEEQFEHIIDADQARDKLKLKAKAILSTVNRFIHCLSKVADPDPNFVVWLSRKDQIGYRLEIVAAPLDVSEYLQNFLFDKSGLESSIWMSATLATVGDDPFGFFKRNVGIDKSVVQSQINSPFDYGKQAILYLPKNLPEPNHQDFLASAAIEIERIIEFSEGRAFVLFTSHAALITTYDGIAHRLPYECKRQGEMPKQKLLEWFASKESAVLFGTASFWEGVSIDGEQLSCVIIDRIPFQSPDDPIYEARCDAIKNDPEASWFNDLALPHAAMRLKQGVGRLIRTASDKGMVAILDQRLTKKRYGKTILQCLPPMVVMDDLSRFRNLDDVFAKPATVTADS